VARPAARPAVGASTSTDIDLRATPPTVLFNLGTPTDLRDERLGGRATA
jgi:hypothetical protein